MSARQAGTLLAGAFLATAAARTLAFAGTKEAPSGEAYHHGRAVTAEALMIDAIKAKKPRRIATLYDGLMDEVSIFASSDGPCASAAMALIPVTLMAFGRASGQTPPTVSTNDMLDKGWRDYLSTMTACETQRGVTPRVRNTPERLSEMF